MGVEACQVQHGVAVGHRAPAVAIEVAHFANQLLDFGQSTPALIDGSVVWISRF